MHIRKLNVAGFSSLILLFFAVVDTAMGDDYPDGKLSKAMILVGKSQTIKLSALIRSPGHCSCRQISDRRFLSTLNKR